MDSQALSKPVVLIGMMGAGKSLLGSRLAKAIKGSFFDIDAEIENAQSCSITEIFATRGENYFRDLEHQAIGSFLTQKTSVLAVGGGAYTFQRNRELIDQNGISVWLDAKVETLWQRVKDSEHRPLLQQGKSLLEFQELLAIREKDYSLAQLRLRTDAGDSIADLIKKLQEQISACLI